MRMAPTQVEFFGFQGGLDQVTPPLLMPAGHCREAQNFEVDTLGGYSTTLGYERFDGRPSPHLAVPYYLPATVLATVSVGQTIVGGTSSATGVVCRVGSDYLVFTKKVGDFVPGEPVTVAAVTVATTTDFAAAEGGPTQELRAIFKNAAADIYRADIQAVPGSGPVLGLKWFEDTLYAWRNNAGGTLAVVHKSSPSGWQEVPLGEEIAFSNASVDVLQGQTLTQGGVTATIKRVLVESGSLQSGTNSGRLILAGRTGGSFSAGAATTSGLGAMTLAGAQAAITLLPGGRYVFARYNFGAGYRLYGCDGVNRGFEFDGEVFAPLRTGMPNDSPAHVAAHKSHLFFAFGNSLQHSAIADPYNWTPLLGAGELNLGDQITNLLPMPGDNVAGGAMACFTRQRSYMLYGNSAADWQLVTQRNDTGAIAHTARFVNTAYLLDNRGVTSMNATDAFGNFASSSLSQLIRPWVMESKTRALDACVVRDKNQYRVLFAYGRVLTMTLVEGRVAGFMPLSLRHQMVLMDSEDDELGNEVVFYGDTGGVVYQAERGTSFDGEPIDSYLTLAFNHSKSPRTLKQYRKVVFEVGGRGYSRFFYSGDLAYADADTPQILPVAMDFGDNALGTGAWDSGTWDSGTWDGSNLLPSEQSITGIGQNMAIRVNVSSDYYAPLTFYGALVHFTPRRQLR